MLGQSPSDALVLVWFVGAVLLTLAVVALGGLPGPKVAQLFIGGWLGSFYGSIVTASVVGGIKWLLTTFGD